MELIIKPTVACNFACTFCSAGTMCCDHNYDKKNVPNVLRDYIIRTKPTNIIVTGGDPLMMDPEYYYQLYELIKDNPNNSYNIDNSYTCISLTTNLKDFYLNPDKWSPLFNEPWIGIGTSFQYGDGRRWDKDTIYTEEMFMKVQELLKERTGKYAQFIAVIDEKTEDSVLDLCRLAKKLNVQVRINNVICAGKYSKDTYPRYKIYQKYFEIIDAGLGEYETNCVERGDNKCPKNCYGECKYFIHCAFVDENGKLLISTCDEQMSHGYFIDESLWYPDELEDQSWRNSCKILYGPEDYISNKCPTCELFGLCNGCLTNREAAKKDPNYCQEMTKIKDKIIDYGWWIP